jgi:hypothetical protein
MVLLVVETGIYIALTTSTAPRVRAHKSTAEYHQKKNLNNTFKGYNFRAQFER